MSADDYLRLAVQATSPSASGAFARQGLQQHRDHEPVDAEGEVLLLREVFRSHLAARRRRSAHAVARKMVRLAALPELTHADLGRACAALGRWTDAAQAYRLAARFAPARRRGLHWGASASAFAHAGQTEEALAALDRAIRWSTTARPLHRAHAAVLRVDRGENPDDLPAVVSDLELAPCGEGYGRYILGLLYLGLGERARARKYLREFLRRNLGDPLKEATLAGELQRARKSLRSALVAG